MQKNAKKCKKNAKKCKNCKKGGETVKNKKMQLTSYSVDYTIITSWHV